MQRTCPAKINLFLEVEGKRPDGFHDIVTVMRPISLFDRLEMNCANRDRIEVRGEHEVPTGMQNTIFKALKAIREETGLKEQVRFVLDKKIPPGSGLGGGSSNAAAALAMLNERFGLDLSSELLMKIGGQVGSDVNFFLHDGSAAICTGRGDRVQPLEGLKSLEVLLVLPDIACSTKKVYERVDKFLNSPEEGVNLDLLEDMNDSSELDDLLFNRLQEPAFELYPRLKELFSLVRETSDLKPVLSGSGSTIFLVSSRPDVLDRERQKLSVTAKKNGFENVTFQQVRTL